jgi:branched-chain amino acid transport system permease protein
VPDLTTVPQLLVNGVVAGGIYALMALGFGVIYNATRIFHIAHGAVYVAGGYVFYLLVITLGVNPFLAVLVVIPASALVGAGIEALVYRPARDRGAGLFALFIISLGLLIFLQNLLSFIFGSDTKPVWPGALPGFELGGVRVTLYHVAVVAACLAIFPLVNWFITGTRTGKAIQALSANRDLADVVGIDVPRLYLVVFGAGSALAGIAAALLSLDLGVRPAIGFTVITFAAIAVIVGGVGHLPGAAVGGLLLGLLQSFSVLLLPLSWQDVVVYGLLFLFLLFRPQGIFGRRFVTREV